MNMTLKQLLGNVLCVGIMAAAAMSLYGCDEILGSLGGNEPEEEEGPGQEEEPGKDETGTALWCTPEKPDADGPMTISFRAGEDSPLYGYKGDVYAHLGVIEFGTWKYVKADWTENRPDCKFTKDAEKENVWHLELKPSVREFFNSGETPCTQIGIVIRSDDSSKKGIPEDRFFDLTDSKYKGFEPQADAEVKALPAECTYGINVIDDNTITFVLHDEDTAKEHHDFAYIIGDFNNWTLANDQTSRMYRDNDKGCWWITVTGLVPDKDYRYQYHIGDLTESGAVTIRMADAFCEKVLDPDNDKWIAKSTYTEDMTYPEMGSGLVSVVSTTRDEYNWEVDDFTPSDDLVIYEMHFRDFTATKDINGALAKLDYLEGLGINAVELMPIQEFDGNDSWGYSPCFYFALDKAYGTRDMYKKFIDECHKRGIAVIIDVVYNHNTGASPLAKIYWDSAKNQTAANNPYFNVNAPHPYNVYHDLNHENAFVKELVKRSTVYLIEEYNIDGFRFDLTKGFTQRKCNESNAGQYDAGRVAVLKEYNTAISEADSDAIVILEHFCDLKESKELGEAGMKVWGNRNYAYCQTAMGWPEGAGFDGYDGYSGMYSASMPFGSIVGFMESHDEERTAYKQKMWAHENCKSLDAMMQRQELNTAFFLTVPGPKMIWQFGELGYDVSIEENGRTGAKPLHWEYFDNADRKELYDTYAALNKFRRDNPEFFDEGASFSWNVSASTASGNKDKWGRPERTITCTAGGKSFMVIGNFDTVEQTITATLPSEGAWKDYFAEGAAVETEGASVTLTLPSGEFKLLTNF